MPLFRPAIAAGDWNTARTMLAEDNNWPAVAPSGAARAQGCRRGHGASAGRQIGVDTHEKPCVLSRIVRPVRQHIVAGLTAFLMLVTGVKCFCQASAPDDGGIQRAIVNSKCQWCCDACQNSGGGRDHRSGGSKRDSDGSCPHCRGTLVSDISAVKNFTGSVNPPLLALVFGSADLNLLAAVQPQLDYSPGTSPPHCTPPTLLGLHCALTL
jgi:hypothetical protein